MSEFNRQYVFVDRESKNDLPYFTPNDDTALRLIRSVGQPEGDAPYIFHNGSIDYQRSIGVNPVEKLPDVLVGADQFYFSNDKFNKFLMLGLPGVISHPCIYIDQKENWHENLWHVYVSNKIDCWDRALSKFKIDSAEETSEGVVYRVKRYYLDDLILKSIPLNERLIFRLGGVKYGGTLIHQRLKPFFEAYGVRFTDVEDYRL